MEELTLTSFARVCWIVDSPKYEKQTGILDPNLYPTRKVLFKKMRSNVLSWSFVSLCIKLFKDTLEWIIEHQHLSVHVLFGCQIIPICFPQEKSYLRNWDPGFLLKVLFNYGNLLYHSVILQVFRFYKEVLQWGNYKFKSRTHRNGQWC